MKDFFRAAAVSALVVGGVIAVAYGVWQFTERMAEADRKLTEASKRWHSERMEARHRVTLGDRVWIARGFVEETAWFDRCYSFTDDETGLRVDVVGAVVVERIR